MSQPKENLVGAKFHREPFECNLVSSNALVGQGTPETVRHFREGRSNLTLQNYILQNFTPNALDSEYFIY